MDMTKDDIVSIYIEINMFMVGTACLEIRQESDCVIASSAMIRSNGGSFSRSVILKPRSMAPLVDKVYDIKLPKRANEDCALNGKVWCFSLEDQDGYQIKGLNNGYWKLAILQRIIREIDRFSKDGELTSYLHSLIKMDGPFL